mgnify:CR=1 FL=1
MDTLLVVFEQLGANESLLHQFIIVVVMFYLTKFLFLNHLQSILDNREDKTVNLEGSADQKFEQVEKIQAEYKSKIQNITKELKTESDSKKNEIIKREEATYRKHESEVNTYVEEARKKVQTEIGEKKEKVLSEAEHLAASLVDKIAKGL